MGIIAFWRKIQRTSSFGSYVLLTAATNIILGLLGLTTGVLAARLLGPQGRGELAAIQLWPSFIATIAMLGLPDALVYFSAREPDRAGRYMGSAMALALLSSFPFMGIGYLIMPIVLSAQSPQVITAAKWYLLLVLIFALLVTSYNPLRGRNDFVFWNGLRVIPSVGWLAVLIVAWLLGRTEPEFIAMSYLATLMLLSFPVIFIVTRRVPGPFYPEAPKWGAMLRYGIPSMASNFPQILNHRLDQMVIGALLPAQELGLYMVAVAWGNIVNPLLNAFGAVLFPQVALQNDREQQILVFAQGIRLAVSIALGIGFIFLLLTPLGVPLLFGKPFAAAIPVALVLVVASAIANINLVMEEGLRGLGSPTSVMWAEFGGLAVVALSLWLLLRPFGIMGAAFALLIGYSTIAGLLIAQIWWLTKISLIDFLRPTISEIYSTWRRVGTL